MEYNYKLLATILVVEDIQLEQQIKKAYLIDEYTLRVLRELTAEFAIDQQKLLRFKGLVYIPSGIRKEFIQEQYLLLAHGYQGITRTFDQLAKDYYFPGIRKQVEKVVSECDLYNKSKTSRHALYGLLQPPPVPGKA